MRIKVLLMEFFPKFVIAMRLSSSLCLLTFKRINIILFHSVENRNLKEQVSLLEAMSKINFDQLRELKLKMKGITEYFHSEEDNFQRKLVVSERKLQQFELLYSEAQEKRISTEKERKEYKDSKQQLRAVIESLRNQVQVNMDRADKAMVSCYY